MAGFKRKGKPLLALIPELGKTARNPLFRQIRRLTRMQQDIAIGIESGRALVYAAAKHIEAHPKDMSKASSMCKVYATDVAMKATTDAVQVMGGYGYMCDYPVEKMMRDAKILQIYEGTNQIQRNVIGQELNKEYSK